MQVCINVHYSDGLRPSDKQGWVEGVMVDMGRFRGFRLKGVFFFSSGFRYEWVGKVEVEEYGKSKGINNRCIL